MAQVTNVQCNTAEQKQFVPHILTEHIPNLTSAVVIGGTFCLCLADIGGTIEKCLMEFSKTMTVCLALEIQTPLIL